MYGRTRGSFEPSTIAGSTPVGLMRVPIIAAIMLQRALFMAAGSIGGSNRTPTYSSWMGQVGQRAQRGLAG